MHMEDVLEVYQRPYDRKIPVVCMDEQPTQLIQETRRPVPAKPGQPERVDFEYERHGTAANFLFTEPLAGWRKVSVRERRTKPDWAQEIKHLLDVDYRQAKRVVLVCDNLNTHKPASLYEAFPPAEAQATFGTTGNSLHAQTWELVKHCRNRTQRLYPSVPPSTDPPDGRPKNPQLSLVHRAKSQPKNCRLAIYHQGRQDQTEKTISTDSNVMIY